jgi:osmoprotectant transport system ATP-binding protein
VDGEGRPAGRSGATVELRHVTVRFGDRDGGTVAVDDLSLAVAPGEICVLVGPSGCGKTTTLRLVNRLVEPSEGQILIDGQDVGTVDPVTLRRRTGYVIQQIGLFPHRTIAENIATVPRLLRWPAARVRARVEELLTLIGLDPARVGDRYPSQLSGGERQRVGVARAMAAEPPLLLMDEPFGAVDPIVRTRLQDAFLRLQRVHGTTVLFVTHDVDEAIKLGTRIAVMQMGGKLAQYCPPGELLLHPASDYVARFLGADRALKRLALIAVGDLPLERVSPPGEGAPRLEAGTSVRDALAALLASSAEVGAVVDGEGRYLGAVTLETIARAAKEDGGGVTPLRVSADARP